MTPPIKVGASPPSERAGPLDTMRPGAQKFKRPQRTPPPPAAVAGRCIRCCGEIDEDDEFLVDLCKACDKLRHSELAAAKRRSAEKGGCGGFPQTRPCEPRLPVSPDSVMAGFHAMRVGPNDASSPSTEPSDGPATDDDTPLDSRGQQSLQPPPRRQRSAHRSATLQWDPDAQEFTQTCREDDGMPAVASTPAPAPAAAPKPKQKAAAAPLPEGWKEYVDKSTGKSYYHNASTSTTTWERPAASGRASSRTEGEELIGEDMEADYRPLGALDEYEQDGLDEGDHGDMGAGARFAAEAVLEARDESAWSPGTAARAAAAECAETSNAAEEATAAVASRPRDPAPSP